MILGTAGHIDHGKTALVKALTGVDTDRLPEEKRRGITIDLGFAPFTLPDGTVLGVVDVPGHEAFVRTMLAGATGIDIALIVIAADEGPMPQTREHLAILQLLDVPAAVVALTKSDLVDPDWLTLVTEEVRELLTGTQYADAIIISTSTLTGAGISTLKEALADASRTPRTDRGRNNALRPRAENGVADLFRLPIDRSFTVRGTGTVVTGTVWSGSVAVDDTVRILPAGTSARVRALQSHGASVQRVEPGTRAAIALAGIDAGAVQRGATLVTLPHWEPSLILRADVTLLPDAPELRPRTRVHFHLATADVGARVIAAGTPITGGSIRAARIRLDEPLVARSGDRFVLRSASPLATIGGGIITDSHATRRSKPMTSLSADASSRLLLFVTESGVRGVPETSLAVRLGLSPADVTRTVAAADSLVRIGGRLYATAILDDARTRLLGFITAHHREHPLSTGAPRQEIRSRLGVETDLFDHLVTGLDAAKKIEGSGAELRLPGKSPQLSEQQQKTVAELLATIEKAGHEPPSVSELHERFGPQTHALLRHLERQQRVVQVEDNRYYTPAAVRDLLQRLEGGMAGRGELAPTELREVLGFSRKYLIPFLEYCDRRGFTVRQGNGRIWRGARTG